MLYSILLFALQNQYLPLSPEEHWRSDAILLRRPSLIVGLHSRENPSYKKPWRKIINSPLLLGLCHCQSFSKCLCAVSFAKGVVSFLPFTREKYATRFSFVLLCFVYENAGTSAWCGLLRKMYVGRHLLSPFAIVLITRVFEAMRKGVCI